MPKSTKKAGPAKKSASPAQAKGKQKLSQIKQDAANAVGVTLRQGDNGHLTSRQAGAIGGQMVKKMIESYEQSSKK
ncbi:MAG: alpha/beta-type small acid-soluble spore protein [Oscillospiraceae bacterium]|nr:alpha/beta-type small acid-soluble spore protein [Oscillospiraceae bacterium]